MGPDFKDVMLVIIAASTLTIALYLASVLSYLSAIAAHSH
jgi:hypothetical protein